MTSIEEQRLAILLTRTYEYYSKNLSEEILSMWIDSLDGEDLEKIELAFRFHIKNGGEFCPRISDIVKAINGSAKDQATIEWGNVMLRARSASNGMRFDNPITDKVVQSMGGKSMGNFTASDWQHNRTYFIDTYTAFHNQAENEKLLAKQKLINQPAKDRLTHEQ